MLVSESEGVYFCQMYCLNYLINLLRYSIREMIVVCNDESTILV